MKPLKVHLYTIGHSNLSILKFIRLLKDNHIACLVDVRSFPYSKFNSQFSRDNICSDLILNNIEYIWLGKSLGGRRETLRTEMGFRKDMDYEKDEMYMNGLVQLIEIAQIKKTAIMCSEEDPRKCHRHNIISMSLLSKNIEGVKGLNNIIISHIRTDGTIENAAQIPVSYQPSLF